MRTKLVGVYVAVVLCVVHVGCVYFDVDISICGFRFLQLDGGLPGRFPAEYRITIPSWGSPQSVKCLNYILKTNCKIDLIAQGHEPLLLTLMTQLVTVHTVAADGTWVGFASGRTVEDLANLINNVHIRTRPTGVNIHVVSGETITEAFRTIRQDLTTKVDKELVRSANNNNNTAGVMLNTQTKSQTQSQSAHNKVTESVEILDQSALALYSAAVLSVDRDVDFQNRYNASPDQLALDKADPKSDYNKQIASKLNITPQEAVKMHVRVTYTIKKLIESMETTKIQRFNYHCPFCGGIDSPTCAYINQPLEWKIQHSVRKPWTEDRVVVVQKEVEEEVIVDEYR